MPHLQYTDLFHLFLVNPELEQGPVLVQIEYKIDPKYRKEFAAAMGGLEYNS